MGQLSHIIIISLIFIAILIFSQSDIVNKYLTNLRNLINFSNLEKFANLSPGVYPISSESPLLADTYKVKNPAILSDENYGQDYPVLDATLLKSNNSIKGWATPDNGLCSPSEFCNSLYLPNDNIVNKLDINVWNNDNNLSANHQRVNMY